MSDGEASAETPSTEGATAATAVPTLDRTSLWVLRFLALAGGGVAGYLLWVEVASAIAAGAADGPTCGGLRWVDCKSVLNSRWAKWLSVPVAAPAGAIYATAAVALFALKPGRPAESQRRRWGVVCAAAVALAGAAGWFIHIQVNVIGRLCSYCMLEHLVGLTLALLVGVHALRLTGGRRLALPLAGGAAPVVLLVAGQLAFPPDYTEVVVGDVGKEGRYTEAASGVSLLGGRVVLDPDAHPRVGLRRARHHVVEVVDYTCPRCAEIAGRLRAARKWLGPDVTLLVVMSPLSAACNPHVEGDGDGDHEKACRLAKLALAVWLAAPGRFARFHHTLFEEQDRMTVERAERRAVALVGEEALAEARSKEGRLDRLVRRDADIAKHLGVEALPGLVAGNRRIEPIPLAPDILARTLRNALSAAETSASGGGELTRDSFQPVASVCAGRATLPSRSGEKTRHKLGWHATP